MKADISLNKRVAKNVLRNVGIASAIAASTFMLQNYVDRKHEQFEQLFIQDARQYSVLPLSSSDIQIKNGSGIDTTILFSVDGKVISAKYAPIKPTTDNSSEMTAYLMVAKERHELVNMYLTKRADQMYVVSIDFEGKRIGPR